MTAKNREWACWAWAGWEPDRHYVRRGGSDTPYFGNGAWLADWRARLLAPQTLDRLVGHGVTTVVTHFYKGFGLDAEQAERERLAGWVSQAQARGLRVIGYTQGGSLYYETFLDEQPEMMDWVARHRDGSLQAWGGSYYRMRPCLTSDAYVDYMARVIRVGTEDIRLDGIHFDNNYYRHCWCPRCTNRFRDWLDQRGDLESVTGLPHAKHVQPPPLDRDAGQFADPMQILWMQFGAEVRSEVYKRLISPARERRPEVIFIGNPAFPRRSVYLSDLALDLDREAEMYDFIFAENGNLPQWDEQACVSQAEAYLLADAWGYGVFNTSWKTGENIALPPQTAGEVWAVMAEEASFHSAVIGNNWMLRATGDGDQMLGDNQPLMEAFHEASGYFKSLHQTLDRGELRQWGEVGLWIEPMTLSLAWQRDRGATRSAILALQQMGLSVVLVPAGRPIPDCVRTLLVVQQTCLDTAGMDQVSAFAKQADRCAVVMGSSGKFDTFFVPRNRSDWQAWRNGPGMVEDDGEPLSWVPEKVGQRYLAADIAGSPDDAKAAITAMLEQAGFESSVRLSAPAGVLMNIEYSDEEWVIHLRDQSGSGDEISQATLSLAFDVAGDASLQFNCPGQACSLAGVKASGGMTMSVAIPNWRHYAQLRLPRP